MEVHSIAVQQFKRPLQWAAEWWAELELVVLGGDWREWYDLQISCRDLNISTRYQTSQTKERRKLRKNSMFHSVCFFQESSMGCFREPDQSASRYLSKGCFYILLCTFRNSDDNHHFVSFEKTRSALTSECCLGEINWRKFLRKTLLYSNKISPYSWK